MCIPTGKATVSLVSCCSSRPFPTRRARQGQERFTITVNCARALPGVESFMKTTIHKWSRSQAGHSILLVMIISTATFLVLGGLLKWSVGNTTANVRNNQYFKTVAAAEAATE